jgi:hypothetical protein
MGGKPSKKLKCIASINIDRSESIEPFKRSSMPPISQIDKQMLQQQNNGQNLPDIYNNVSDKIKILSTNTLGINWSVNGRYAIVSF